MTRNPNNLLVILLGGSLISLFTACLLGATPLSVSRVLNAILGQGTLGDRLVIWHIRLPRALAAFLVGAALGVSGAALQGLLRNPLAEPGVLGVSATSSLVATFAIYYGVVSVSSWAVPIAAIIGALMATSLIALPFSLSDMINWTLGSVANRSFQDILLALPFLSFGFITLFATRRGLSALTLGDEAARGLGVNLRSQRICVVLGAGLATGAAVSIAGAIGFVGIVAPHLMRPFVDHDPARSLIPSALLAGIFLVVADIGVRLIPTQTELKLGVVAALIGAPAFVWIAVQRRGTHRAFRA